MNVGCPEVQIHEPIFCNSEFNPNFPRSSLCKRLSAHKEGHSSSSHVSWSSGGFLPFLPLRGCGFKAFLFPVRGCLALLVTVFFNRWWLLPLISVSLVSVWRVRDLEKQFLWFAWSAARNSDRCSQNTVTMPDVSPNTTVASRQMSIGRSKSIQSLFHWLSMVMDPLHKELWEGRLVTAKVVLSRRRH